MAYITRKYLPRRTFLRGMGVTLSLPLLESMIPAQTPLAKTAASPKSRLSCIYVPHGATMDKWTPATEGNKFEFTEILAPLDKYRDRVNILSNLAHPAAAGVEFRRWSRSYALGGCLPEWRASRKRERARRHDSGSDRGPAYRPGHPAPFSGTFH